MNRLNCSSWLCLVVALAVPTPFARATVINVPADELTIQAGIDASTNGDEIIVADGVYNEVINFAPGLRGITK